MTTTSGRDRPDVGRLARAQLGGRLRQRPGCRCRPSRSTARPRAGRPAPAPGSCAAPRAAGRAPPGRARGGRRRGRRPGRGSGAAGPAARSSASTSCTSRTRALNAAARSAHSGSSASRWPYSFIDEPQPATLVTTWSTSSASNRAIVRRARRERVVLAPGVQLQRAAALLVARHEHVVALGGQHPHGGLVDAVEEHVLHAAGQQRHPAAAARRRPGCAPAAGRTPRAPRPAAAATPSRPSRPGSRAASARDRRHPAQLLVERAGHGRGPQPPLVREQREDRLAEQPVGRRRGATLRSICGRTDSSSRSYCTPDGHAVTQAMQPRQASMCSVKGPSRRDLALLGEVHQVDPAARGVHLLAPQLVGGAGRQAEAAVHAVVEQLARRRAVLVEGARAGLRDGWSRRSRRGWSQALTSRGRTGRGRAGRSGSSSALTARSTASADGGGPQAGASQAAGPVAQHGGAARGVHGRVGLARRRPGRPAASRWRPRCPAPR